MIIIVAGIRLPRPAVPLASDTDSSHDRQKHDQNCSRRDAHVSDIEDRPVRQFEEVDHMSAEHSRRTEQPIGEITCHSGAQQSNSYRPGWMADPWDELDDHEGQDNDPGDGKDISKTLALAEGRTRVTDESQCDQSAQQANRGKWLKLVYRDDLGDKISRQPGDGDHGDQEPESSPLDRASVAG
jgi:hypothetical protein